MFQQLVYVLKTKFVKAEIKKNDWFKNKEFNIIIVVEKKIN